MLILYMGQRYNETPKLEAVESEEIISLYPFYKIAEDGTPRTVILLRGGIERVACLSVEDIVKATGREMKYICGREDICDLKKRYVGTEIESK